MIKEFLRSGVHKDGNSWISVSPAGCQRCNEDILGSRTGHFPYAVNLAEQIVETARTQKRCSIVENPGLTVNPLAVGLITMDMNLLGRQVMRVEQ